MLISTRQAVGFARDGTRRGEDIWTNKWRRVFARHRGLDAREGASITITDIVNGTRRSVVTGGRHVAAAGDIRRTARVAGIWSRRGAHFRSSSALLVRNGAIVKVGAVAIAGLSGGAQKGRVGRWDGVFAVQPSDTAFEARSRTSGARWSRTTVRDDLIFTCKEVVDTAASLRGIATDRGVGKGASVGTSSGSGARVTAEWCGGRTVGLLDGGARGGSLAAKASSAATSTDVGSVASQGCVGRCCSKAAHLTLQCAGITNSRCSIRALWKISAIFNGISTVKDSGVRAGASFHDIARGGGVGVGNSIVTFSAWGSARETRRRRSWAVKVRSSLTGDDWVSASKHEIITASTGVGGVADESVVLGSRGVGTGETRFSTDFGTREWGCVGTGTVWSRLAGGGWFCASKAGAVARTGGDRLARVSVVSGVGLVSTNGTVSFAGG